MLAAIGLFRAHCDASLLSDKNRPCHTASELSSLERKNSLSRDRYCEAMIAAVARHFRGAVRQPNFYKGAALQASRALAVSSGDGRGEGTGNDGDDEGDEDDEFGMSALEIKDAEEFEDLDSALDNLSKVDEDVTPELASELVAKMVDAATKSHAERSSPKGRLLPAITAHTISVLKASRIATNLIQASGSDLYPYPITKKVTAHIDVDALQLSRPAREALELISGARLRENWVKISCNRYQSSEENQAYAVTLIDRLVAAAKESVGEAVDTTPLESWDEIEEEVGKQASEEIGEAGGLTQLLGTGETSL